MRDVGTDLAAFTTLRLGGRARRVVEATDQQQIIEIVRESAARDEPLLVLGGGSNVVISDDGVPGVVLVIRSRGIGVAREPDGTVRVTVAAGQPWDDVVVRAVEEGWSGIECMSGIPGSSGATPIQNVSAYGQEIAERIVSVRVYDRSTDAVFDMTPEQCRFAYRMSIFKQADRWIVLSVDLRLARSCLSAPIRYAELAGTLGVEIGAAADAHDVREAVLKLRAGKGMVLDPTDPDTYSVGSFFTNPVLPAEAYALVEQRAAEAGVGKPSAWPAPEGAMKVSAAWLIERAGFHKGYGGPDVAISSKHTLALTNRGTGTTAALLDLARQVRSGVLDRFGVELHPEPVLVNCSI